MSSPPRRGAIIVDETPPAGAGSESTFNYSLTSVNADPSLLFSAGLGLARSAQGGAPLPVERVMVDSDDDVPFKAKSTMQFSRNYSVFSSKLPGVGLEIGGEKVEQEGRIGVRGNLGLPVPGIAGGGVKSDPEFSSTPKKKKESKAKTLKSPRSPKPRAPSIPPRCPNCGDRSEDHDPLNCKNYKADIPRSEAEWRYLEMRTQLARQLKVAKKSIGQEDSQDRGIDLLRGKGGRHDSESDSDPSYEEDESESKSGSSSDSGSEEPGALQEHIARQDRVLEAQSGAIQRVAEDTAAIGAALDRRFDQLLAVMAAQNQQIHEMGQRRELDEPPRDRAPTAPRPSESRAPAAAVSAQVMPHQRENRALAPAAAPAVSSQQSSRAPVAAAMAHEDAERKTQAWWALIEQVQSAFTAQGSSMWWNPGVSEHALMTTSDDRARDAALVHVQGRDRQLVVDRAVNWLEMYWPKDSPASYQALVPPPGDSWAIPGAYGRMEGGAVHSGAGHGGSIPRQSAQMPTVSASHEPREGDLIRVGPERIQSPGHNSLAPILAQELTTSSTLSFQGSQHYEGLAGQQAKRITGMMEGYPECKPDDLLDMVKFEVLLLQYHKYVDTANDKNRRHHSLVYCFENHANELAGAMMNLANHPVVTHPWLPRGTMMTADSVLQLDNVTFTRLYKDLCEEGISKPSQVLTQLRKVQFTRTGPKINAIVMRAAASFRDRLRTLPSTAVAQCEAKQVRDAFVKMMLGVAEVNLADYVHLATWELVMNDMLAISGTSETQAFLERVQSPFSVRCPGEIEPLMSRTPTPSPSSMTPTAGVGGAGLAAQESSGQWSSETNAANKEDDIHIWKGQYQRMCQEVSHTKEDMAGCDTYKKRFKRLQQIQRTRREYEEEPMTQQQEWRTNRGGGGTSHGGFRGEGGSQRGGYGGMLGDRAGFGGQRGGYGSDRGGFGGQRGGYGGDRGGYGGDRGGQGGGRGAPWRPQADMREHYGGQQGGQTQWPQRHSQDQTQQRQIGNGGEAPQWQHQRQIGEGGGTSQPRPPSPRPQPIVDGSQSRSQLGGSSPARACFNCQEVGHMARDCPRPQRQRGGGGGGGGSAERAPSPRN